MLEPSVAVNPDAGYALIVNYLPPSFTDHDLHQLFSEVGPLYSAKIMRNKVSFSAIFYGFFLPYSCLHIRMRGSIF